MIKYRNLPPNWGERSDSHGSTQIMCNPCGTALEYLKNSRLPSQDCSCLFRPITGSTVYLTLSCAIASDSWGSRSRVVFIGWTSEEALNRRPPLPVNSKVDYSSRSWRMGIIDRTYAVLPGKLRKQVVRAFTTSTT